MHGLKEKNLKEKKNRIYIYIYNKLNDFCTCSEYMNIKPPRIFAAKYHVLMTFLVSGKVFFPKSSHFGISLTLGSHIKK